MEIVFLKRAWRHVEEQRRLGALNNRRASYAQVEKGVKTQTRLSVVRICEVAGFSRADYHPEKPARADLDLRDQIQKSRLEWPSYGRRRSARVDQVDSIADEESDSASERQGWHSPGARFDRELPVRMHGRGKGSGRGPRF
jgi:hypothetical protein